MNNYVALILDIKHSKEFSDIERSKCQMKLYDIINIVNNLYKESIVEKMIFSGGDSIQGLFNNIANAINCYFTIKYLFYPYEIRCGVGYGKINEYIVKNKIDYNLDVDSNFVDGDSYHMAISALTASKENDYDIILQSNNIEKDLIFNQLLYSLKVLEKQMSNKQKDIFTIFNLLSPVFYDSLVNFNESYYTVVNKYLKDNIKEYVVNLEEQVNIYNFLNKRSRSMDILSTKDLLFERRIIKKDPFESFLNEFVGVLLSVSRENIRQMVEKGNFNEIRRLQITALSYVMQTYGKELS